MGKFGRRTIFVNARVYAGNVCTALPRVGEIAIGYRARHRHRVGRGLAIAAGANPAAVKQRLQQNGINPSGL